MKNRTKFISVLLSFQGFYYLITGVWPIIDVQSFMAVTGPKTDIWLLMTVSVLISVIALTLIYALFSRTDTNAVYFLAWISACVLAGIDFFYPLNDVISNVYMVDGVVQLILIILWPLAARRQHLDSKSF